MSVNLDFMIASEKGFRVIRERVRSVGEESASVITHMNCSTAIKDEAVLEDVYGRLFSLESGVSMYDHEYYVFGFIRRGRFWSRSAC